MGRKRKKPDYLSEREFNCLELYIRYGNKRKAGEEAGYSKKTAATQATRLINGIKGQRYLEERLSNQDNEKIASSDEVMEYLTSVMRGEINDQFDLEPSLQERTKAATELAKRLIDVKDNISANNIIINCDIPRPERKEK